jgi:hypothetical protein
MFMTSNKYHHINYEIYFHNKLIWSYKYEILFTINLVKCKLIFLSRNP